jgi:hypothetical protein
MYRLRHKLGRRRKQKLMAERQAEEGIDPGTDSEDEPILREPIQASNKTEIQSQSNPFSHANNVEANATAELWSAGRSLARRRSETRIRNSPKSTRPSPLLSYMRKINLKLIKDIVGSHNGPRSLDEPVVTV